MSKKLLLTALVACATWVGSASAAGMRVLPLRLDINPKSRLATLELTNLSPQNMAVQMDAKAWHQEAGSDVYTDTSDLFFAPPVFAIAAGKTKTVRFRLKRGADVDKELVYRVYAQQIAIPPGMEAPGASMAGGVDVKLRFGIPLFVPAIKATPPTLEAGLIALPSNTAALRLKNSGATHLKIFHIEILPASGEKVLAEATQADTMTNYLLSSSESVWSLKLPGSGTPAQLPVGSYRLRAKTDYYSISRQERFSTDGSITLPVQLGL